MALWVLGTDFNLTGTLLRAGKVIDDAMYDVVAMRAAGALLYAATAPALARAAQLSNQHTARGQGGFSNDEGLSTDRVGAYADPPASAVTDVLGTAPIVVTSLGGTRTVGLDPLTVWTTVKITFADSPYTVTKPNVSLLVDPSGGAVLINLPLSTLGGAFEVVDYGNGATAHNISVKPPLGWQMDDPNAPGAYLATDTAAKISINGASCTWRSDGSSKLKALL